MKRRGITFKSLTSLRPRKAVAPQISTFQCRPCSVALAHLLGPGPDPRGSHTEPDQPGDDVPITDHERQCAAGFTTLYCIWIHRGLISFQWALDTHHGRASYYAR